MASPTQPGGPPRWALWALIAGVAAIALIGGLWSWAVPHTNTPAQGPMTTTQPTVVISPEAPPPTTPAVATPTPSESYDPRNPTAEQIAQARDQAVRYLTTFNSYGYGDDTPFVFLEKSKPYMSTYLQEENEMAFTQADEARRRLARGEKRPPSEADFEFDDMVAHHQRQEAAVDSIDYRNANLTRGVPTMLFSTSYRTAIVSVGQPVPPTARAERMMIAMVFEEEGNQWLVLNVTHDI